jgi:hypothetical protein
MFVNKCICLFLSTDFAKQKQTLNRCPTHDYLWLDSTIYWCYGPEIQTLFLNIVTSSQVFKE